MSDEKSKPKERSCADDSTFWYGRAISHDAQGYFHIREEDGMAAYPQRYIKVEPFQKGGWAFVRYLEKKWKRIDINGNDFFGDDQVLLPHQ